MSLLRRIRDTEARTNDNPPAPPPTTGEPPGAMRELWQVAASSRLLSVAITRDSRFILAGSMDGDLLCCDITGRLLWREKVDGAVLRLALAEEANAVLVGTVNRSATLWSLGGYLMQRYTTGDGTWGANITPDASLIAVGSLDGHLYLLDQTGEQRLKHPVGSPIRQLSLTTDRIFVSTEDGSITAYDHDGGELWRFATQGRAWAGIAAAESCGFLIAGSNDHYVYGLDFDGGLRWKFDTGGFVNTVTATPDGRFFAAAGQANTATLFDDLGNLLWEHRANNPIYGLALSDDGRFMAVGSNDSTVALIDRANNYQTWRKQLNGRVYGVALSPGGKFLAAPSTGKQITLFDNAEVPVEEQALRSPDSRILARHVLQLARDELATNPHAGLVRWFSEFERSLRGRQFDACRALLDDIQQDGFLLNETERGAVQSLEGVYWLFRGALYHQIGDYAEARTCYDTSRHVQDSLNNRSAVGQIIALLAALEHDEQGEPTDSAALLAEIIERPRVLSTSEKLLEQRVIAASPAEQFDIVLVAKDCGYLAPLLRALHSSERVVRAAAAAAMTLLEPGPDYPILAEMLVSTQSFVRWQALRILRYRVQKNTEQVQEKKDLFWPAVLCADVIPTADPLARCEEAYLIKDIGDTGDMPWLLDMLNDPDPDVQIAAIDALGSLGDREALPALEKVPDSYGFSGQNVRSAAADAIDAIQRRFPLPEIDRIVFCSENPAAQTTVDQSSLFLTRVEMVYAVVSLTHTPPGTHVTTRWMCQNTLLAEQVGEITAEMVDELADIRETPVEQPSRPFGRAPARPFGRPEEPAPRVPLFRRDTADSPFGSRSPIPPAAGTARPGSFPLGRRSTGANEAEPATPFERPRPSPPPDPNENIEPSLLPAEPEAEQPAPRPGRIPSAPAAPEPVESPGLLRRLLFTRQPAPRPGPFSRPGSFSRPGTRSTPFGSGSRSTTPPRSAFGDRTPAPPRPGGGDRPSTLPRPTFGRPGQDRSEPGSTRPGLFGTRPAAPSRPTFGAPGQNREETAPPRSSFGDRPFGRSPFRRARDPNVKRLVFALPRPAQGWAAGQYQIDVALDGDTKKTASFNVVEQVELVKIETGFASLPNQGSCDRTSVFLIPSGRIECLAHLEPCPVGTAVTGTLSNVATGTVFGDTTVYTTRQGKQNVRLVWENIDWPPGQYRLAVAVEQGNRLQTDITLIDEARFDSVTVCHQVDSRNGPVGTGWPFYPGDTCFCVVEMGHMPPGLGIEAAWYRKGQPKPLCTGTYTSDPEQEPRAIFEFEQAGKTPLAAGHYSVVIDGELVVREERTFDVLPHPAAKRARLAVSNARQKAFDVIKTRHLIPVIAGVTAFVLLALALLVLDAGITYLLGTDRRTHDVILNALHTLSRPILLPGWLAVGMLYGLLGMQASRQRGRADAAHHVITLLLAGIGTAVIGYPLAYLLLGPGYRWPDALWGLSGALAWLAPLVAWSTVLAGARVTEIYRRYPGRYPFYQVLLMTELILVVDVLAGYVGAILVGLTLGLLGAVLGELLELIGITNRLGYSLLDIGAGAGFIGGALLVTISAVDRHLRNFVKGWRDQSAGKPLLDYLCDRKILPLQPGEALKLSEAILGGMVTTVFALLALAIIFDPVLVPGLAALTNFRHDAMFEKLLEGAPLIPLVATALVLAWPVLIFRLYRAVITPDLEPIQRQLVRRISIGVGAAAVLLPLLIALASRLPGVHNLAVPQAVFWISRIALLTLALILMGWTVFAVRRATGAWTQEAALHIKPDQIAVLAITALALVALPARLWIIMLALVMMGASGGVLLARVTRRTPSDDLTS